MTPQKVLAWYEQGRITAVEAVNLFIDHALDQDPATFAVGVPSEWLAELRELSDQDPPPRTFRLGSWCNAEPFDPEAWAASERAARERYVAGLRTWKEDFESVERLGSSNGAES